MSSVTNPVSDQPGGASGDAGNNSGDVVKYETYQKVLAEKKALQTKLGEIAAKEAEREQSSLAEQGKFQEAAQKALEAKKAAEDALSAKDKAYAKNVFNKEVRFLASQLGAKPEALDDIVKVGDFASVEIDDQFNVNSTQLKESLLALQKSKPYYFNTSVPRPNDVNSSANGFTTTGEKKLDDLSAKEIEAQLRALGNK